MNVQVPEGVFDECLPEGVLDESLAVVYRLLEQVTLHQGTTTIDQLDEQMN